MSKSIHNHLIQPNNKRRQLLKGLAIGSVATATGLGMSSTAMAFKAADKPLKSALPCCDLTIYQNQSGAKEIVTLINNTGKAVTVNEVSPIGLSQTQGSLSVKVTVPNGPVTIPASGRLSFEISASTANTGWNIDKPAIPNVMAGNIEVKSQHPAFNGIIPVTVFDAIPA